MPKFYSDDSFDSEGNPISKKQLVTLDERLLRKLAIDTLGLPQISEKDLREIKESTSKLG